MSAPPPRYPAFDNHFHLDPNGKAEEAVREFVRAGGTHLMIVHKPYHREGDERRFNGTLERQREDMETTLALAERVRANVPEVTLWVAMAPHPAEFTKMLDAGFAMEDAKRVYREATDLAASYVRDGRAVAMGEVGRPHWEGVPEDVWAAANELMDYQFAVAKDVGCPVIIHCETGTPEVYADLAKHCDAVGFPRDKAVKHFSPPLVDESLNHGLFPSVMVGKNAAEDAVKQGLRFMMETDYMDDPRYPGAVLGPRTVPRRTRELIEKEQITEDEAWIIHSANPRKVFGVDVEL